MTQDTITLVRASWQKVHAIAPAKGDMQSQGRKLMQMIGQGLGDDFTPPVRQAWTEVYGAVAGVMTGAASTNPIDTRSHR
jgi:hemoglobin-like flavoprotein